MDLILDDATHAERAAWLADNRVLEGVTPSPIAICTLWTRLDLIRQSIPAARYRFLGNCYSRQGISLLLRTLLLFPEVRCLVLCGMDLSGTGAALRALWANGVDDEGRIVGDGTQLDRELPTTHIKQLARHVRLIDHVGITHGAALLSGLDALEPQPREPWAMSRSYPLATPQAPPVYPSEASGWLVRAETVSAAWALSLQRVMRYGNVAATDYDVAQKEIIALMAVVENEQPDQPKLPPWLPLTSADLDAYYPQVLTARTFPGVAYTYGERLRTLGGVDQIAAMADELRRSPHSRRALASTWDATRDAASASPPCLITVHARRAADTLHLMAHLRSSDVYRAWPKNAFALRRLQADLARELGGLSLGPLVIISGSAHVYADNWEDALAVVRQAYPKLSRQQAFTMDPRGAFVISLDRGAGQIVADFYDPQGQRIASFRDASARALRLHVGDLVGTVPHAIYLGVELARAEAALRTGEDYVQDAE